MKKLNTEDFVGVWENQNTEPYVKEEELHITFRIASPLIWITKEPENGEPESIATGKFHVENGKGSAFAFVIEEKETRIINCRNFTDGKNPGFVAEIEPYGEVYMERK